MVIRELRKREVRDMAKWNVKRQYYDDLGPSRTRLLGAYTGTQKEAILKAIKANYKRDINGVFVVERPKGVFTEKHEYYVDTSKKPPYLFRRT